MTLEVVLLLAWGLVCHGILIGSTRLISREYAHKELPITLSLLFLIGLIGAPVLFVLVGMRMT